MNDLLPLLRETARKKGFERNEKYLHPENVRVNVELQHFIQQNKEAQKLIKELQKNNNSLRELKKALVSAVSAEDKKYINQQITEIITSSSQLQGQVKNILTENSTNFIQDINDNANLLEQEKRISKNLHGATVKNFQDTMYDFQNIESDLKTTNENMILQSAKITLGRPLTDEERVEILENPEMVQKMMQDKLGGQAHSSLVNAVKDLEERHKEIVKLEKSIMQVHQLIEELAALVKLQGEMVDNICDNIASAKTDVTEAEEDIVKAKEYYQKARKKKCILLLIVVGILVAIALPIIFKFT